MSHIQQSMEIYHKIRKGYIMPQFIDEREDSPADRRKRSRRLSDKCSPLLWGLLAVLVLVVTILFCEELMR